MSGVLSPSIWVITIVTLLISPLVVQAMVRTSVGNFVASYAAPKVRTRQYMLKK